MSHIFQSMLHPHGWWIILDLFLIGSTGTICLMIADDNC